MPDYDPSSLEASIRHRKKTIKNLKQAIAMEEKNIKQERELIEILERKKKIADGIEIDASKH